MTCANGDKFRIKSGPDDGTTEIIANASNIDICRATKILDRLHKEFTEQYVESTTTGKTKIASTHKNNPTFFLRNQPTLAGFNSESASETAGTTPNRFYTIFTTYDETNPEYRGAVSAIMKGDYDDNSETKYDKNPEEISGQNDLSTNPNNFKGIYGLVRVNELLENKIADVVNNLRGESTSDVLSDSKHYEKRQNIKSTLKEIARRENEIYREKFLNIILMIVGIFLVSTQLVQKYFSFGGGSGGIGSGSSLFSGVGFGTSGGGIFSRFGGLGLGSSGRSRVGGLFTNSPYSLSQP